MRVNNEESKVFNAGMGSCISAQLLFTVITDEPRRALENKRNTNNAAVI